MCKSPGFLSCSILHYRLGNSIDQFLAFWFWLNLRCFFIFVFLVSTCNPFCQSSIGHLVLFGLFVIIFEPCLFFKSKSVRLCIVIVFIRYRAIFFLNDRFSMRRDAWCWSGFHFDKLIRKLSCYKLAQTYPKPMLLSIACAQRFSLASRAASENEGVKTLSICIFDSTSSIEPQNLTWRPAAIAAPMLVISFSCFLTISAFIKSD